MIGTKITQQIKHRAWVFSFMMVCLFFCSSLIAQGYPPLVSEAQAEVMLKDYMPVLQADLENETEGTPGYRLAERKLNLYAHTWETIVFGKVVEEALTDAFGEFATDANGKPITVDEMPPYVKESLDYGDNAFDGLVNFLSI